jgi:hypothetical protein
LMVPETESLSSRIIVLPTGASTPEETVEVVGQVFRLASFT